MPQEEEEKDLFTKAIGQMGRWQVVLISLIFPCKVPIAWHQMAIIFLAPPAKFVCMDNVDANATIVYDSVCYDACTIYHYDRSVFTETIVTQWDLICKRKWMKDMTQTTFMLGILVGSMFIGHLADRYGRRKPFLAAVVLQLVSGVLTAFAPNYYLFSLFRFLQAIATGGHLVGSFVIIMEMTGSKYRECISILYHLPFVFGLLTLPAIGYFARDWSTFQLAISLPSILFLGYYFILPESARWLITKGRKEEATKIMEKAAKRNGLPYLNMAEQVDKITQAMSLKNPQAHTSIVDLFRIPRLRMQTCCISFNWLAVSFCFYGVVQYIGQASGNIFINGFFSAGLQIPATIGTIYLLKIMGRKPTLMSVFCVGGLSCLAISLVPVAMNQIRVGLGIVSVMCFTSVFANIYLYTGELFPTVVRNIGVGFSSTMARIGSMIAPFIASLNSVQLWLPPVIFGTMPIIGCILCSFLPETRGRKLPDTLEDV